MKKNLPNFGKVAIFDDLAQIASGAASALGEVRHEVKSKMRSRAESAKTAMRRGVNAAKPKSTGRGNSAYHAHNETAARNTVPIEDFEAALLRITALSERIEALEAQLASKIVAKRKPAKKTAKKSSAKKA